MDHHLGPIATVTGQPAPDCKSGENFTGPAAENSSLSV